MEIRKVLACVATLLMAGCGDEGENEAAELSGVFQAGSVNSLHYVTPTRSGLTDAHGTFKYLAGESVTFSVGGLTLGRAPGAARITPFTLAGMTPPTTEPELRRELDRASRTTSSFVRATNIARLLLALDADHNPANGIDLRGRARALASATLDFDQTIVEFATALEKLAPDLTHNLPRWAPIVHLYRVLGITVPAHAPVNYEYDYNFVGAGTQGTRYSYYPDGSLESRESYNGLSPFNVSVVYGYDPLGRLRSTRVERQQSLQGSSVEVAETRYDVHGNLSNRTVDFDDGADGMIDLRVFTEFETDAFANTVGEVTEHDLGHDGSIDRLDTFEARFDARLNRVHSTSQGDANVDGEIDSRSTVDSEFDAVNRLVSSLYENDDQADGIVDSRQTNSIEWAPDGRRVIELYEGDTNADGVVESRARYDWDYDSSGVLRTLTIEGEYDFGSDDIADLQYREVATFDRDRRVLTVVSSQDNDGDGIFEYRSRRANSFDSFGNILEEESETDSDDDGEWDFRDVTAYEYGAGAELLGHQSSFQYRAGGGSFPDRGLRVTNMPLENGVLMLAQSYLEYSFPVSAVVAF